MTDTRKILKDFQTFLKKKKIDLFIVSSTDEYLSEYVLMKKNSRYLLTGFSGSTGDALITTDKAFLFVDGRYHLQAEKEIYSETIELVKVELSKSPQKALYEKLASLCSEETNIGFCSSKISCAGFKELLKNIENKKNIKIIEIEEDPVAQIAEIGEKTETLSSIRFVPEDIAGKTPLEKLGSVNNFKKENNIDFLLITDLADIAYLTDLRGSDIPYSSCCKAKAVIYREDAYIFMDKDIFLQDKKIDSYKNFIFKKEKEFNSFIEALSENKDVLNVYYHPVSTPLAVFREIEKLAEKIVEIKESYISGLKSVKTSQELEYIKQCYIKTDIVVNRAMCWLKQNLEKGEKISEKDFSDKVKTLFNEEGAVSLSFEPITAAGKNTAFIHYTDPDPNKYIEKDDLLLLDCGAYFEGGYATDQTRTVLAGGKLLPASCLQKHIYTAVLKGLIAGLDFEISEKSTGYDLDQAVREVVESNKPEGFDFSHATGHGVGISVHEAPPRIGPLETSKTPLKPGMVFTIEPGLYNESHGGVRIENTVMTVEENGKVKIKTLTKAPFDDNLINYDMLNNQEKNRLEKYNRVKIG